MLGKDVNYDPKLTRVDLLWLFCMNGEGLEAVVDNLENDINYDVEILFISHFNNITYEQYFEQPLSNLTRKFLRRYMENGEEIRGFDWIPASFKAKCNAI